MAYISKEKTAEIRALINKNFPAGDGWKFSIRNGGGTSLDINILQAPVRFSEKEYEQLNEYYPDRYLNSEVLKKLLSFCHTGLWFLHISQGAWNKPFELWDAGTAGYKIKKSYFRGDPKFGRCTQLLDPSGAVIFEAMGACSKSELINSFQSLNK